MIIVSYSEIHQAFERAFTELMNYGGAGPTWEIRWSIILLSKTCTRSSLSLCVYIHSFNQVSLFHLFNFSSSTFFSFMYKRTKRRSIDPSPHIFLSLVLLQRRSLDIDISMSLVLSLSISPFLTKTHISFVINMIIEKKITRESTWRLRARLDDKKSVLSVLTF